MKRAKDAGYEVGLVFVALRDAELNVQRAASGGHNIPQDIVRRRYDVSLRRLGEAIRIADSTLVFDIPRKPAHPSSSASIRDGSTPTTWWPTARCIFAWPPPSAKRWIYHPIPF